jgi:hypothetical protein
MTKEARSSIRGRSKLSGALPGRYDAADLEKHPD